MLIVIDGPAGSGKSSVCKKISEKLNLNYLDTGWMYRLITWYFLNLEVELEEENFAKHIDNIKITYKDNELTLNDLSLKEQIRTDKINQNIGKIADSKIIRLKMVELQREIVKNKDFIADGRDLGTVVFPECENKFYLNASVDKRAERRARQNAQLGLETDLEQIKKSIIRRDQQDMNREFGALSQASDAILIDTDDLTLDEVVAEVIKNLK